MPPHGSSELSVRMPTDTSGLPLPLTRTACNRDAAAMQARGRQDRRRRHGGGVAGTRQPPRPRPDRTETVMLEILIVLVIALIVFGPMLLKARKR